MSISTAPGIAAGVELAADTELATAGYFQLRWNSEGPVELLESTSETFANPRTIYTGSDRARVMSGKPDGRWYYRVRSSAAPAARSSDIVMVTVRHHPLRRAVGYFTVGAVVFFATLYVIVTGARHRA